MPALYAAAVFGYRADPDPVESRSSIKMYLSKVGSEVWANMKTRNECTFLISFLVEQVGK